VYRSGVTWRAVGADWRAGERGGRDPIFGGSLGPAGGRDALARTLAAISSASDIAGPLSPCSIRKPLPRVRLCGGGVRGEGGRGLSGERSRCTARDDERNDYEDCVQVLSPDKS
jgi:hypothetical protein